MEALLEIAFKDPFIYTPPDELVEIMDENGNIGTAFPCYYPFKISHGPKTKENKTGIIVTPCDPFWDESWLIAANADFMSPIDAPILGWRKIRN